jgi:hypothetical protein
VTEQKQPGHGEDEYKKADLLKKSDLLLKIIKEVQKNVVGEEESIMVIVNKIALRLVKNAHATSSNILVSDKSGGGKDNLVKSVCRVMLIEDENYLQRTSLSEKVLNYWNPGENKEKGIKGTWDGKVLVVEDPKADLLKCDTFRTMSSGGNHATTININRQLEDIKINGKPTMIITSVNANIDDEGNRRWDAVRVDTSDSLTRKVKELRAKIDAGLLVEKDKILNEALSERLERVEVVVPYAQKLAKMLPDSLIMRTQSPKLADYVKASAALHQHQREKAETGAVIAEDFDYWYGLYVFKAMNKTGGVAINIYEEEILKILENTTKENPLAGRDILTEITFSKDKMYRLLGSLTDKGLARAITKYDSVSGRDIGHFYSTKGQIGGASSWLVFEPQDNVFSIVDLVFSVDLYMCSRINEIRQNQSLSLVEMLFTHNGKTTKTTKSTIEKQEKTTPIQAKTTLANIGEIKPFPYKVTIHLNKLLKFDLKVMPGKKYANLEVDIVDYEIEFASEDSCTIELFQNLMTTYGNKYSQMNICGTLLFLNRIPMENFGDFMEDLDTILHCLEIYSTNMFCKDSKGNFTTYYNKLTAMKFPE